MLTEQAIEEFMLSRGGLRPKTQREYLKHLAQFQRRFPDLPETPQPIQSWLNGFQGVTPETVHARFRTIRAFYNQIYLWHPEIPNPMPLVRPPRLLPKAMRTFTGEDLFHIFNLPLSPRDRVMATLFLDTGLRAQECANLTWDEVWPDYMIVGGKTGERDVPISETTYRLLQALKARSNHSPYVFPGRKGSLTYDGVYRTVRRICRQAGIDGKRCSPNTFRHTFGTEYASGQGCDPKALQEIMGHRDFKTTLKYIHHNRKRLIENHHHNTPLRLVAAAAQRSLFGGGAVRQAEEVLEKA